MSYDISLVNMSETVLDEDGDSYHPACQVTNHQEGGTYALGGTTDAAMSVTYNYAEHFGFRWLDGKTGAETAPAMAAAVASLGTTRDKDYWKPAIGNAGYAINILLGWAREHPNGIWSVD